MERKWKVVAGTAAVAVTLGAGTAIAQTTTTDKAGTQVTDDQSDDSADSTDTADSADSGDSADSPDTP